MVNRKKKGDRKELRCANELKVEGYKIVFRGMTVKIGPMFKGLDFADCIDVVGCGIYRYPVLAPKTYSDGTIDDGKTQIKIWRFISCTHEGHTAEKITALKEFADEWRLPKMMFEVWSWLPAKWKGRGKKKVWRQAGWEKVIV